MKLAHLRLIVVGCLTALLLPSCGLFKKKEKPVLRTPNIRLSGRVQTVNKDSKFVLIRRYGPWKVDEGEIVESRGENRTANLAPTGEKLGEHVAADIRSGEVEVGDAVYIRRVVKKDKPQTPAATTKPQPAATATTPPVNSPAATPAPPVAPAPVIPPAPPAEPELPAEPEDQL
ncbi:hypothetical protein NT6N_37220 [Oceaniferula spumae]|uniref:Translation initiation factor 2 n=1 Tax=Oceaniferula spumae TaxID=2979115 RepID=A0AAT9FRR1_9BACT